MPGKFSIPEFTNKDTKILIGSMLPMSVIINYILFGNRYFHESKTFLFATPVTFVLLSIAFVLYGMVAIFLRNRFPEEKDIYKRLTICLAIFSLLTALYVS